MRKLANVLLAALLLLSGLAVAQNKAMTNADVIKMSQSGLGDDIIISSINASEANFDVSADGLIALHKAKVSNKVLDAIMQRSQGPAPAAAQAGASGAAAAPAATPGQPQVTISNQSKNIAVPAEKTQIAQSKTKGGSLDSMAADAAVTQAVTQVAQQAALTAAYRSGSGMGAGVAGSAISGIGGIMARRKPTVTHIWALPGASSATVIAAGSPKIDVQYAGIPGIDADQFEPTIVKLVPSTSNFRLVGATEAKQDVYESMDWQAYSSFTEDRVPTKANKVATGHYTLEAANGLGAGEYGVVLRPVNKAKKFSGHDIQSGTGEGMLFNSVWAFKVQ